MALAVAACGDAGGTTPAASPADLAALPPVLQSPGAIDPALLQPLRGLGPCDVHPNAIDLEPIDGLVLPPDAVVTERSDDGPLTTVRGYVPLTPVQIRVVYQRDPDLQIVQVEDEVRESETLLDSGEYRLFVKAQAVCEQGSVFLAVLAPRVAQHNVPAPAGGGSP
ncbi:MAG: hypothetical protein KY457_00535 [Actinobacteria bacterium]|nr:hypothetical protein [Actinomycetota bacterium]